MNLSIPPPSLEPTLYFLSNSLTVIAVAGFVFFMLGLWFGYLTWGRYKRRARAYQEETNLLRLEIARLKRRLADDVIAPAPAPVEKAEPVAVLAAPEPVVVPQPAATVEPAASAEPEMVVAPVSLRALIHTPADAAPPSEPAPVIVVAPEPVATKPTEAVATASVINEPPPPVEATPPVIEVEAQAPPAPSAVVVSEPVIEPTPAPAPVVAPPAPTINELASRAFASELASGTVRCDSSLGVLYAERPDRWDDLTLMRGVADITQQKLHDCGIYTFKQIAVWDDRTMREVGHATHMGDRIVRDRWAQQARDLHYLKYGEKLG